MRLSGRVSPSSLVSRSTSLSTSKCTFSMYELLEFTWHPDVHILDTICPRLPALGDSGLGSGLHGDNFSSRVYFSFID